MNKHKLRKNKIKNIERKIENIKKELKLDTSKRPKL